MKERKRFLLYYDWENLIQDMNDTDIASLTRWIFKYQNTWEISDMTYWAKLAFAFMRPVFDEDRKDWEEIKIKNSENAKKRWDKKVCEPMRPHTTECEPMRASTDSVSVIDNDIVLWNKEVVEKHLETIDTGTNRYNFYILLLKNINLIKYTIDGEWLENIESKLLELRKKVWTDSVESEIQKFWEHHRTVKSKITSSISIRLDNWITKIK